MNNIEIKRILVPVDFSKTSDIAMNEAIILAKLLKADVFLLHVMESIENHISYFAEKQGILPSASELEKAVERKLNELQEKIRKESGITPDVSFTTGHIHSEIISFSQIKNIDLIVMGTHGASGYKDLFIGTNAQRVVILSEIPVLSIQNKIEKPCMRNILIPIDNSVHSREKVNLAIIFAELFGSKIHIVGLSNSNEEQELNKFKIKLESVEKIVKLEKLQYFSTVVRGDNLAEAAIDYATKNQCDLIIINTGHESKLGGIFLGAFAQQIVNQSKVPVLSFKHSHGNYSIDTPGFGIS